MILGQVSRYVEEPLKGALEECAYEAQTTGDSSLALLSMAERIEHPKIKELARNLEISIRYMADLTTLVDSSRRSAREYLRMEEERKGMLREAGINMALLLGMSVFALLTVDRLIDVSVWKIVSGTLPGHLAVGVYGLILFLFLRKLYGFAASQGGVENELESYLDSRTVGSGAGRNFCVPAGYGNNAENGVACLRGIYRNAAGEPKV